MKKMIILAIFSLFFSSPSYAGEIIKGHYCYTCGDNESLKEGREITKTLAIRDAVESHKAFIESTSIVRDFRLTSDIIQIISSGHLEDIKVIEHTEKDRTICETIEVSVSPKTLKDIIKREIREKRKQVEELGVDNNGCLKILRVKREKDRYGYRIQVIVKVLRRTGSLFVPHKRNKKPCFKICIDFFDLEGVPIGGDSKFIHESDVEMLAGEIKVIDFYAPFDVKSYRVWLKARAQKTKKVTSKLPLKKVLPSPAATKKGDQVSLREEKPLRVLKDIRPEVSEGEFRVEVLTDGPIRNYEEFFMDSPPRLVIDLPGEWKEPEYYVLKVKSEMAERIRIGRHHDKLRVVIDIKDKKILPSTIIQESPEGLIITIKKTI